MRKLLCILLFVCVTFTQNCYAATGFTDVQKGDWCYESVTKAAELKIINGYPDGSFKPNQTVTCKEFLIMAAGSYETALDQKLCTAEDIPKENLNNPIPRRLMALVICNMLANYKLLPQDVASDKFTDVAQTDIHATQINTCAASGILIGLGDGTYRPDSYLTRAAAATAFIRLNAILKPNGGTYKEDIPASEKTILEQIDETVVFTKENGKYYFKCHLPEVPADKHLSVSVYAYSKNVSGPGSPKIFQYISDAGYIYDPTIYDPSERDLNIEITMDNLTRKKIVAFVKLIDVNTKESELIQYAQEFNGSRIGEDHFLW